MDQIQTVDTSLSTEEQLDELEAFHEFIAEFVEYKEYVTIEFDSTERTAKVLPR